MPARHKASSVKQIAETRDARLIHQDRLHRRSALRERLIELAHRHRERIRTEARLVGIELDRAEPARVAEKERSTVVELDAEAMPRGTRRLLA